jgi:hypothetical protein
LAGGVLAVGGGADTGVYCGFHGDD